MKIESQLTDEVLLKLTGERLARLRLSKNLTQEQLAQQAGLGLRTVQRLELGVAATRLSGFLRVCRVLGLAERFAALVPEQTASPMELLKQQGRKRQRASGKPAATRKPKAWTWGEPE
ncbi:XRE family transcriptional regulator [Pseudolysobacter antarcticus]|uniref:XRE family transcriptional regulator n=1 Tax=Pseudolysobacter antarcticus TaxID=2511995 RepID=A0A411HKI9_9GAMM|nr:helix-turn-helix transcriptional regulator [Pseudolysobacter antarcticus]QBB71011.1 XRE family transcriptional regulator [Pseudolysobacter antarcticus]